MVKGILFDFDGVIADTEPLHYRTFNETLKELGIKIMEDEWKKFEGTGSDHIMKTLFNDNKIEHNTEEWIKKRRDRFWDHIKNNEIPLKKGLLEFLNLLDNKGIKKAVCSGSRTDSIEYILEKNNIRKYFQAVCGIDQVKNRKPDPEVFLLGAKKIGVDISNCIIIEDSIVGVQAARKTSAKCVFFSEKKEKESELKGCSAIIRDYSEFPLNLLEE
ncbi:MAG: HAD family phosphatase [Candidatus ainarchaeum sp.]|nr:HAD family phosphatase [Candidatus ainarchaeum sp.]